MLNNIFAARFARPTANVPSMQAPMNPMQAPSVNLFGQRLGVNVPSMQAPAGAPMGGGLPPMQPPMPGPVMQPPMPRPVSLPPMQQFPMQSTGVQPPVMQRPPLPMNVPPAMGNIFRARMGMRY